MAAASIAAAAATAAALTAYLSDEFAPTAHNLAAHAMMVQSLPYWSAESASRQPRYNDYYDYGVITAVL